MNAIYRRELRSYFSSPLAYCFLAAVFCFGGLYFFTTALMSGAADLSAVFSGLFTFVLFALPLLSMRTLSEDQRSGADQLLLTAPVSGLDIILGKYLAALTLYTASLSCTLVFAVVLSIFQPPSWPTVLGGFLGLWLAGAALLAAGVYCSSRTQSQLVAGIASLALSLMVLLTDALALLFPAGLLRQGVLYCSFSSRVYLMMLGLFRLGDLFFFISITAFFLWLTAARIGRRRVLS